MKILFVYKHSRAEGFERIGEFTRGAILTSVGEVRLETLVRADCRTSGAVAVVIAVRAGVERNTRIRQ